MFIELTTCDEITFLFNIHCIEQVCKNGEGCLIYIQNDDFSPYCVREPYEYLRNVLLNR